MNYRHQHILKFILLCIFSVIGVWLFVETDGTWTKALFIYLIFTLVKMTANLAYHRWLAHNYIEPGSLGKFILLYCIVAGALVRPIIYIIIHRLHHRHSDTDLDPHPPSLGFWNLLIGNFNEVKARVSIKDVSSKKEIIFVNKHFYKLYFANLILWALIDIHLVFLSFLFLNIRQLVSVTLFNYLGHGGHKQGGPKNLFVIYSFLLEWFGEQLHKNHHDDPSNPNFGRTSLLNFDITYHILKLLVKTKSYS